MTRMWHATQACDTPHMRNTCDTHAQHTRGLIATVENTTSILIEEGDNRHDGLNMCYDDMMHGCVTMRVKHGIERANRRRHDLLRISR